MITPTSPRYGTNWEEKLLPAETISRKEDGRELRVVTLRGLQRLSQEAGLVTSYCEFSFIAPSPGNDKSFGIMQCIYTTQFSDGTSWTGAADCNHLNTSGKFSAYPTAIAESRAEARCLRKALNIGLISSEEVGLVDGVATEQLEASPNKKIDSQVVKAIEKLCETRNITTAEVLDAILSKARNSTVFELGELTVEEGQKAMGWLNDQKPAKVKKSAAEERSERKQELLAQTKKDI